MVITQGDQIDAAIAVAAETEEVFRVGGLMDVVRAEGAVVGARLLGLKSQAVRHLWEAARLAARATFTRGVFPSLREGIGRFTEAAYGKRLDFDHS